MGLDSVLVITDTVDENLLLASRNLPNVLVVEPRYADPLSLVHYKKVLVTKAAIDQDRGDAGMSAAPTRKKRSAKSRLMQVLLAPIVSEKATHGRRQERAGRVQGRCRTPPSPRSRPPSS